MKKKRYYSKTAFVLIVSLLFMMVFPHLQGIVKADEQAALLLYEGGTQIGSYTSLADALAAMTKEDGTYQVVFGDAQQEYRLDGEVWLPKVKKITFKGNEWEKNGAYKYSTIIVNDDVHMQSDVVLDTMYVWQENIEKDTVFSLGTYCLTVQGEHTQIGKSPNIGFIDEAFEFAILGKTGSCFVITDCSFESYSYFSVDMVILNEKGKLFIYGTDSVINEVKVCDLGTILAYLVGMTGMSSMPRVGKLQLYNSGTIYLNGNVHLTIQKIVSQNNSALLFEGSQDYAAKDMVCHCVIKEGTGYRINYHIEISRLSVEQLALLRNTISLLKVPKEFSSSDIHFWLQKKGGTVESIKHSIDDNGNAWLEAVTEPEKKELCYELDEESKDCNGIYYTLNNDTMEAMIGDDSELKNNAQYTPQQSEYDRTINLPDKVKKNGKIYMVTRVGQHAFEGSSGSWKIIIPDTVKSIGAYAFAGGFGYIEIGAGVSEIGSMAFNSIYMFLILNPNNKFFRMEKGVLFDADMKTLIHCLPVSYSQRKTYIIPSTVTTVTDGAFMCTGLRKIQADSVTQIGKEAFTGNDLQEVSVENVEKIDEIGFFNCSSLKKICLGNKLIEIGKESFALCHKLRLIYLPDSIQTIGERAFADCKNLQYALGASHAEKLGEASYENCSSLSMINMSDGVKHFTRMYIITKNVFARFL